MAVDYANNPQTNKQGNVYVDASDAIAGLRRFNVFARTAAKNTAKEYAEEITDYMKKNAPWNDITGNARRGLGAEYFTEDEGSGFFSKKIIAGVRLYHSVKYGIFLEYNGLYTPSYLSRRRPILVNNYERGGVISALNSDITQNFLRKFKAQFSGVRRV